MLGYLLNPALQLEDINGLPLVGGWLTVYRAGTTFPYITCRDFDMNRNPVNIVLDEKGMAVILAEKDGLYDVYAYDRNGVQQWSRLNVCTIGAGGGGEPSDHKRCVHRLLRYYTNAGDADETHPVGDWLHDLDGVDPEDPSGYPMVRAEDLFYWLSEGQIFVLYEVDSQGDIEKWNAPYQLCTWQDQSEWWSQYAPEPGKAVRIEFVRLGAYSTPYRSNMIAYIRYKDEEFMRLYEIKPGQSVWTAEYQEKLPYYSSDVHNGDFLRVKIDGSALEWAPVSIPTVNDAVLTIQKNGSTVETFTANSSTNKTANIEVPTKVSELDNDAGYLTSQVQSNWTQSDSAAVDYIRNKKAYKTYVHSYDYPDCMHVRSPGAYTSVLVYYPYEDRKKVLFADGHVYNLRIITSGIQPQDESIEAITARLFVIDTNRERKYLCPPYTFKPGNSAQFDLNWVASDVLSLTEALLDECAPHIEFNCILKANTDVAIYCNGLEWVLNEYVEI